jgi:hypothetical protein
VPDRAALKSTSPRSRYNEDTFPQRSRLSAGASP